MPPREQKISSWVDTFAQPPIHKGQCMKVTVCHMGRAQEQVMRMRILIRAFSVRRYILQNPVVSVSG